MSEHQRRYVVRWLRESLAGRAGSTSLLPELKRWFYEHRILLTRAYGAPRLAEWDRALTATRDDGNVDAGVAVDSAAQAVHRSNERVLR